MQRSRLAAVSKKTFTFLSSGGEEQKRGKRRTRILVDLPGSDSDCSWEKGTNSYIDHT